MRKYQHGGIPLASLPDKKRRQITSHAAGHSTNSTPPHQGSKEAQRRARQIARLSTRMAGPSEGVD